MNEIYHDKGLQDDGNPLHDVEQLGNEHPTQHTTLDPLSYRGFPSSWPVAGLAGFSENPKTPN